MSSIGHQEFITTCDRQGIVLHDAVAEALETGDSGLEETYEPNGIYAAIVAAGQVLRKNPAERLTNGGLLTAETAWQSDVAAVSLQRIVNASVELVESAHNFRTTDAKRTSMCEFSETAFTTVLSTIDRPNANNTMRYGSQIFTTPQGIPLAVRKSNGEQSAALFVEPLTINGIPYPAGSVGRIDTVQELAEKRKPHVSRIGIEVLSTEDIGALSFGRLSGFSLAPAERLTAFGTIMRDELSAQQLRFYETTKPDQLRAVIQRYIRPSGLNGLKMLIRSWS